MTSINDVDGYNCNYVDVDDKNSKPLQSTIGFHVYWGTIQNVKRPTAPPYAVENFIFS